MPMDFHPVNTGGIPAAARRGAASFSAARRRRQRAVGLSIARRRLPLSAGKSTDDGDDESGSAGPNLLFRRGEAQLGGSGMAALGNDFSNTAGGAYLTAAFLAESVVLAADSQGRIDAVRMPRYFHPTEDGAKSDGGSDCASEDEVDEAGGGASGSPPRGRNLRRSRSRERGTLVASRIGTPIANTIPPPYIHLKSVRNGEAFVAGTPSGEVRLFATEHGATWKDARGKRGRDSSRDSGALGNAQFLGCVARFGGARRRYCRELISSQNSLLGMLRDESASWGAGAAYSMAEIPGWNDGPFPAEREYPIERPPMDDEVPVMMPRRVSADDALWDFREVGSKVLAVNVDRDKDCFVVRSMDDTAWNSCDEGVNSNSGNKSTRPIICVDLDCRENGVHVHEDITGVCFAGDHCIATAHVIMFGDRDGLCDYTNTVKWWDRRMMSGEAVRTSVLSSFPRDDVYGGHALHESCLMFHQHLPTQPSGGVVACPNCTFTSMKTRKGGKQKIQNLGDESHSSSMFISRLTSASDGVPSVAISLRSDENSICWASGEILIDASTFQVKNHFRLGHVDCSRNQYEPFSPPAVFTPEHDFMASLGTPIDGLIRPEDQDKLEKPVVRLFDISRCNQSTLLSGADSLNSKRKKRTYTCFEENNAGVDGSLVGSMPAGLRDSYDLQSKCTCMAMNDLGTTLVCGSADGDLFAWQGG